MQDNIALRTRFEGMSIVQTYGQWSLLRLVDDRMNEVTGGLEQAHRVHIEGPAGARVELVEGEGQVGAA